MDEYIEDSFNHSTNYAGDSDNHQYHNQESARKGCPGLWNAKKGRI